MCRKIYGKPTCRRRCRYPKGHAGQHGTGLELCETPLTKRGAGFTCGRHKGHKGQHSRYRRVTIAYTPKLSRRDLHLRDYHGITQQDYDLMLAEQNGVCAICGGPPTGPGSEGGWYQIDHDHRTLKIRGLLCGKCNSAVKLLGEYLEENS